MLGDAWVWRLRALVLASVAAFVLSWAPVAVALTAPISGAVPYPSTGPKLYLPFPAGSQIRVLSGYSPSGGSSLHADTNDCCKANDYYALDLVYEGQPSSGKGLPIVAPIPGKVLKAGWSTAGWANYGLRVILEHDLGDGHVYHSMYAHMDSVTVTEGATVSVGQELGKLGQSCQGALSCGSFSTPHLHWSIHRDSSVGGSGTGGSYGGNAVVPEPLDGAEDLSKGDVITSTNSSNPVCGDQICNGTETPASCPGDCPTCAPIPPTGRVVDDSESMCFTQSGTPQYWHAESAGYQSTLLWTYGTSDPSPDNYAVWSLDFAEAGDYALDAYTDGAFAQSQQAQYVVEHGGQTSNVTLDQSAQDGWQGLGTFAFDQGASQSVRLNDNTGEAVSLKRQLVFDAIRLTRVGGSGGSGGVAGSGAGGAGGTSSGGGGGAPSGGTSGTGAWGGAAGGISAQGGSGGASGGASGAGAGSSDDSGCGCGAIGRARQGSAGSWVLVALGAGLLAARRRRR